MLKEHRETFSYLFRIADYLILLASFVASFYLRFGLEESQLFAQQNQYVAFCATYFVAWFILSNRFRLYGSKRLADFSQEIVDVTKATLVSFIIALVPAFFIRVFPVSRLFLAYLLIVQIVTLLVFRFLLRVTLRYIRRRGYNFRHALIVGRNKRAASLVEIIKKTPDLGIKIIGYIDDYKNLSKGKSFEKIRMLGALDELEAILRSHVVDEVFIYLPIKSFYSRIESVIEICEAMGVEAKIPTDLFNMRLARSIISNYGGLSVIDVVREP